MPIVGVMSDAPENDHWKNLPHRVMTDKEVDEHLADIPLTDPLGVAMMFAYGLDEQNELVLETFTNPESRPNWGDYQAVFDMLAPHNDWGIGGNPDIVTELGVEIAYVKILPHVTENFEVLEPDVANAIAVLSLVKRPDIDDRWFVQAIGDYWHPSPA
jgi:hypothetical protein